MYRIRCDEENEQKVEKYRKANDWELLDGPGEAFNIAGDEAGEIWIRDSDDKVMKWDLRTNAWVDMTLDLTGVNRVAAGMTGRVYALAKPKTNKGYTIWAWQDSTWIEIPGKTAIEIAVG